MDNGPTSATHPIELSERQLVYFITRIDFVLHFICIHGDLLKLN